MKGQVKLYKRGNDQDDVILDVTDVLWIEFTASNGNSFDVKILEDDNIRIEADGLQIEPRASNMVYIHTKAEVDDVR